MAMPGWNPNAPGFTIKVSLAVAGAGAVVALLLSWPLDRLLGSLFRKFNVVFNWSTALYAGVVGRILRVSAVVLVIYGGLLYLTWYSFDKAPSGFIPMQDKGYLLVNVQLPDAASVQRTLGVMSRIEKIVHETKGVKHTVAVSGQSILLGANSPNFGALYVMLDDFHKRSPHGLSADKIAHDLEERLRSEIDDAVVGVYGAPPVDGLGTAGGFKIIVEDRSSNGLPTLQKATEQIVAAGRAKPAELQGVFSSFRADTPWIFLDINREQAKVLGLSVSDVFTTLQVFLGSLYVNDLNWSGRTWQVNVQSDARFRRQISDIKQLSVKNAAGQMVPLSTIADFQQKSGPVLVYRYNMYSAAPVNGGPAPGVSSGEAIALMENIANRETYDMQGLYPEWTELALLAAPNGQHGDVGLHSGRGAGVPRAGGAIRKLVAAAGGDPRRADVPAVFDRRRGDGETGREHLHADRLRGARRAGLQERDFDRRVRQAAVRAGPPAARGHRSRLQAASAADHDDLAGLHSRRRAAGGRHRRRGRDAPHSRHGRLCRDARRDALRHLPHAGVLQRHPVVQREVRRPQPPRRRSCRRRASWGHILEGPGVSGGQR